MDDHDFFDLYNLKPRTIMLVLPSFDAANGAKVFEVTWPFTISYALADWLHNRAVISVSKTVDFQTGIPSVVFEAPGQYVFRQDGFNIYAHDGELLWDFLSDAESCVRLEPAVIERLLEVYVETGQTDKVRAR